MWTTTNVLGAVNVKKSARERLSGKLNDPPGALICALGGFFVEMRGIKSGGKAILDKTGFLYKNKNARRIRTV